MPQPSRLILPVLLLAQQNVHAQRPDEIHVEMLVSGDVSSYGATEIDAIQTLFENRLYRLSSSGSTEQDEVSVTVEAGSVKIEVEVMTKKRSAAESSLASPMASALAATAFLQLAVPSAVVEATPVVVVIEAAVPWGTALGASIIVVLCTFMGVVFVTPCLRPLVDKYPAAFSTVINAFAAGALLACAFYLILFEATHYIAAGGQGEGTHAFLWGTAVLLGFVCAQILDIVVVGIRQGVFGAQLAAAPTAGSPPDEERGKAVGAAAEPMVLIDTGKRTRVLCGILLGDFLHNLCDGVFIGSGFLACGDRMGWTITVATIYHEIAQEVSDLMVLIDKAQGNLSIARALLLNFLSGFSVILGAVVVLAQASEVNNRVLGLILAFSGGVYVQIGAAECMPRVYAAASSLLLRLVGLAVFSLGALCIGIVLIDHKHCVVEGGAHAGHNH